jgi:hypothetical protein
MEDDTSPAELGRLNRAELAEQLAHTDRRSARWNQLRAECERRARRWGAVARTAAFIVLGCLTLVALALIAR